MVVRRYEISLQHEKRNFVSVKRPYVLWGAGSNYQSGPQPELDIWWRHPNFQHGPLTKGHDLGSLFSSLLRLEMTFSHSTLGAAPLNDEEAHECEKMATDEVCVFSRGKTAENGSVSAQRSTWEGAKYLTIECGFQFFDFWKKKFEIYIKFACWWWFCCRSAKHFHIALCVWICNSELHQVRIFVTPCLFYVLLQCDGKGPWVIRPFNFQLKNKNCKSM